jgi:hypothetical protein
MSKSTIEITGIKITIEDGNNSQNPKEKFPKGGIMSDAFKQATQERMNNIREQIHKRNLEIMLKELFGK